MRFSWCVLIYLHFPNYHTCSTVRKCIFEQCRNLLSMRKTTERVTVNMCIKPVPLYRVEQDVIFFHWASHAYYKMTQYYNK